MLTQFNHYLPVNLIFGAGKTEELGKETAKYGRKAMIVTGQNSTKRTGLLDRAKALMEKEGLEVVIFDKAEPNPLASTAMKGAAVAKEEGCDVIVGLGGGSIMDCSKAVAFAACNEGNIFDYIYGIKKGDKALPLILVPTTCGTGSEGNCFAVLTEDDKEEVANGADAQIYLEVEDITDSVPEADKALVEEAKGAAQVGMYLDVKLWKQIGSAKPVAVENTNGTVTITFTVPASLRNTDPAIDRTYQIIRVHD